MSGPGIAQSNTPDNIVNIANAVWDIALNRSTLLYAGHRQWIPPRGKDLAAAGYPYLVVTWPEFAGYARQMQLIGKEMPRDIEDLIEKVWDVQVAVYYQWDSQNPLTITTALDALTKLQTAFELNWGLPDTNGFPTCEMGTIVEPKVRKVTTVDNLDFTAAMLTVRTRQALPILY